jgi:hypothetical protein
MDVHLASTHIYTLNPTLDFEAAEQQAIDKRISTVSSGLGGLFSRPKPEEVELVYKEIRYESFWHAVCTVRYVFERNKEFTVPVTGVEVRKVTLLGQEFEIAAQPAQPAQNGGFLSQIGQQIGLSNTVRTFTLSGVEHCIDENRQEQYLDAVNGQPLQVGADYVQKDKTEVTDLSPLSSGEVLVVAPQMSAAKIAKSVLAAMIKPIEADKILEETVTIETLDLYFRPVYAFEFAWKPKNKTGVAEIDAVTGALINGKALHTKSDKAITREGLFDINAETVTSLIPTAAGNVQLVP